MEVGIIATTSPNSILCTIFRKRICNKAEAYLRTITNSARRLKISVCRADVFRRGSKIEV